MNFLDRLRPRGSESDPMQAATVMTVAQLRERNRKFIIFMQHKVQELESALADYQQYETEMVPADEADDLSWAGSEVKGVETEPEVKEDKYLWSEEPAAPEVEVTTFETTQPDEDDDLNWARPAAPIAPEVEGAELAKMEDWMSLMGVTINTETRFEVTQAETAVSAKVEVKQAEDLLLPDFTGPGATGAKFSAAKRVDLLAETKAKTGGEITPAPGDTVESVGFGGIQDLLIQFETDETR